MAEEFRSNQFDYVPVRELPGFSPDARDCPAVGLGLARVRSSRVVVVRVDDRSVLCRTDTGDFSEEEIREVVHHCGQLYLDVSSKASIDDFGRDLRQVVLAAACRACPRLATCCACYVPAEGSFFHEDERWLTDWIRGRRGRLLDVGMGSVPYRSALEEAQAGGRLEYLGLDPDPAVADRAAEAGLPVHPGTIESFDARRGPFESVMAIRSLNHFEDVSRAFQVMWDSLAPGGDLLVVESLPLPLVRSRRKASRSHQEAQGGWQHRRNLSSHQVLEIARRWPFEVVRHRPVGPDTCDQWFLWMRRPGGALPTGS
ncbi:methyltransferase domain-containing protein [Myxococcota bacterium]|nr:methyltransferase domain-containing protein [Myxococcota bacterium]